MPKYKIATVGKYGVGKTSIMRRARTGEFRASEISTIGVECLDAIVTLDDNKKITLKIYDTAGQERFRSISNIFKKTSNAILYIFDISDRNSFTVIKQYIDEDLVNSSARDQYRILIANKIDLEDKYTPTNGQRNISKESHRVDKYHYDPDGDEKTEDGIAEVQTQDSNDVNNDKVDSTPMFRVDDEKYDEAIEPKLSRIVPRSEIEEFSEQSQIDLIYTSAKTGANIDDLLITIGENLDRFFTEINAFPQDELVDQNSDSCKCFRS